MQCKDSSLSGASIIAALPFRNSELELSELKSLFGNEVDVLEKTGLCGTLNTYFFSYIIMYM